MSKSDQNPTEGLGTEVMKRNISFLLSACNGCWPCGFHLNRTLNSWRNHITYLFTCMRCAFVLLIFLSSSWSLTWPTSSNRLPPCSKLGFAWCFLYRMLMKWEDVSRMLTLSICFIPIHDRWSLSQQNQVNCQLITNTTSLLPHGAMFSLQTYLSFIFYCFNLYY